MSKLLTRLIPLLALLWVASCAGSTAPDNLGPDPREGLNDLDFELVTDPDSNISSSEVEGWLTTTSDAQNARNFSAASSQVSLDDFQFLQGMYFEPSSTPGSGFSGRLSVRIQNGAFANNTFENVLLFLFWVNPSTKELSLIDSSRGRKGNWFDFDINALGHMLIAENTTIPRPGENFRVSAFADQAATGTGTVINFYAIPENGVAPIMYSWDMGDGTQLSGDSVSHSYNSPGSYNVTLNAFDGAGSEAPTISTPIDITSSAPPLEGLDGQSLPSTGDDLTFTFSATVTGGRAPFSYEWDFDGDGTTDSTDAAPVDFTFDNYGFYIGTLKITDQNGDSITTEIVSDARRIDISVDQSSVDLGTAFGFTVDAQGLDVSDDVLVDMDDGNVLTNPGVTFSYTHSLPGTYVVRATAERTFEGTVYTVESNELTLTVFAVPQPVITDFTPKESPIGGRVLIAGLQFGTQEANDQVLLNGLPMTVISWTDTLIEIEIADGATDGSFIVRKDRDSNPSDPINIIPGPPDNPGGQQT
ncbi:MAG: PKD domain-containing protein [Planctomycetales bacterium]|nr:PKD domain-containing protein [bacterium]UNM07760.1 MAG: PKD domain-containing protein [Planctomycetales bacterium]